MNQPPYGSGPGPGWGPANQPGPPQGPPGHGPQPFGAPPPPGYGPPGYGQPGYGPPGYGQSPYGPPKKSNAGLIIGIVIGVTVLGFLAIAGLGFYVAKNEMKAAETTQTIQSTDGISEIDVPSNWTVRTNLNEEADIQVGDKSDAEFLIVISESKDDFSPDFTLTQYADAVLGAMKTEGTITEMTVGAPTRLEIDSRKAIQYEISGTLKFVKIGYVITFIEGKKTLHQILVWAQKSRLASKKGAFQKMTESFRER